MSLALLLSISLIAQTPAPPPAKKIPASELPKAVSEYLEPMIKSGEYSGAILVAKDGKVVFSKAAGYAHLGHKVPNNIDTKFNLASMGKMLTSVAAAQLVEAGKLTYTDPIGKFLPDFPNEDVRNKVTLHHLLTHTSGVTDIFTDEFFNGPRDKFRDLKDYMPLFQGKPLQFEPGSKTQYSNGGFCLAGFLIEKASGIPYWDYVRKHIFEPAGMKDSGPFEMDIDTPNLAYGYSNLGPEAPYPDKKLRNNLFTHSIKGTPAGGSFSTVGDLFRFDQALRAGKLLSKSAFEKVTTNAGNLSPAMGYGYGFFVRELPNDKIVGHSGGFLGISARIDMYLKSGWTVISLSNYDNFGDVVAARVRRMILEELSG